jgi:hypothetical protein
MAKRENAESKLEQANKKVAQLDKDESAPSALDDPNAPDQPSHPRHWFYAAVIILGGLVLNILLIALLGLSSGG